MFLPPNTTALIQPMDQNVIQNIKLRYRKLLLTSILNDPVHNQNLGNALKKTVTAEDDDDDNDTSVNSVKISHSEAVAVLNTSLQWAEEQNSEARFECSANLALLELRCLPPGNMLCLKLLWQRQSSITYLPSPF
ncbi:hypothetical protein J437_LFUL015941 [Ladona fulva]|uniref:DDE-1 domain-containing protein n=1 Tax=Ladona fulva TaxID=123851 RepID=A0A8K0PA92_LADFU|nr:hypothetical protein J437_LFUL015941 [Ladona fulva]